MIGTGASAIQLIPEVADRAEELLVFQRTPNWFVPAPDYHANLSDDTHWLMDHVPNYSQWYRFWLFWRLSEGILPAAEVEPGWSGDPRAVGARSDELRQLLTMYLEFTFGDDPELLAQVVPQYPPLAKRMLLDNGIWPNTLKRDDVAPDHRPDRAHHARGGGHRRRPHPRRRRHRLRHRVRGVAVPDADAGDGSRAVPICTSAGRTIPTPIWA